LKVEVGTTGAAQYKMPGSAGTVPVYFIEPYTDKASGFYAGNISVVGRRWIFNLMNFICPRLKRVKTMMIGKVFWEILVIPFSFQTNDILSMFVQWVGLKRSACV